MTIDFVNAKKLALQYLEGIQGELGGVACVLVEAGITEDDDGWYFPYQSVELLRTGDCDTSLVGNWPIFVSRDGLRIVPSRKE